MWKSRLDHREALAGSLAMLPSLLDEDEPTAASTGGGARRAGAGERIENDVARSRKRLDEWRNRHYRLLISVKPIAGVLPGQYVCRRLCRLRWPSLCQQKPDFMEALGVALPRAVRLCPREMAHGPKTALLPDFHETVDPGPAVEGGAE